MDNLTQLQIRSDIAELNARFTRHLDHHEIDALAALFAEDALYTHGDRRSCGRAAIHALFVARGGSPRTARHVCSGLLVEIDDERHARGSSVCLTFAADALPPIRTCMPHLVADFDDRYLCGEDGRWRFAERHISRIFAAPDNPGPVPLPPERA